MSKVTVCLTNWKRPENLVSIIQSLKNQTIDVEIFLWNNGESLSHPHLDFVIHSSRNLVCTPRWYMATFAESKYICIMDDDIFLQDNHIFSDLIDIAECNSSETIIGPTGVILKKNKSYKDAEHIYSYKSSTELDVNVDIIKGSFMFLNGDILKQRLKSSIINDNVSDDIIVSSLFTDTPRQHLCISSFGSRFISKGDDEFALWKKNDHYIRRQNACELYFPQYYTNLQCGKL